MISPSLLSLLADAAPVAKGPEPGMTMIVYMIFAFVLIYLISIRPQQMKAKKLAAQISATKTGDKVITGSGIHGMISNVKESTFILKIADNVKIEIEKSSVATIVKSASESSEVAVQS